MDISEKRKKATQRILSIAKQIDLLSEGGNVERYQSLLSSMSDSQFVKFMEALRDKKTCLYMYIPNLKKQPSIDSILELAKKHGVNLFHRLKIYDDVTKQSYLTEHKYPVFKVFVRRQQQFLDKKMSVPQGDTKVDMLSGQVAWEDKAASITNPEIQAMVSKGLINTLNELVAVRGGNVEAWNGEMKQMAEETGFVNLSDVGIHSKTRTSVVAEILFRGMMLDTNLTED